MTASETCYYCGEWTEPGYPTLAEGVMNPNFRTRDHVISKKFRQSGESVPLVTACAWCNVTKGDKTVESWIVWIRRRADGSAQVPAKWEVGLYKAGLIVKRWEAGKIKKFVPKEKPHLVHRRRNGLFVCTCGTISARPCQIAAV